MITNPNVKINLGLNVLRKREDGFHDLETLFAIFSYLRLNYMTRKLIKKKKVQA